MSAEILTLFEINAIVLVACTISMVFFSFIYLRRSRFIFTLMLLVPAVAALAYALMSVGIGFLEGADGTVNMLRYADWIITTPILLYVLASIAVPNRSHRWRTFLPLMTADVVMLLSGAGAEFFTGGLKIALFSVSMIAYIAMLYMVIDLMISLNKLELPDIQRKVALGMAWIILILWSLYPLIWILGVKGVALVSLQVETIGYILLDILTKVGFGSLLLWHLHLQAQQSERSKT